MLLKFIVSGFLNAVYRSRAGLWVPRFDALVPRHQNILAVLGTEEGKLLIPGSNLVTDAGDLHFAQRAVAESLTNAFGIGELASASPASYTKTTHRGTSGWTFIGSTQKAHAATYPKRNDGDADNTGAGVDIVSYLQSYTKADFNAASIESGIITNTSPGASEPILNGYDFASTFSKTANDTLKVFQNFTMNGV